jgi:hypothetical protein
VKLVKEARRAGIVRLKISAIVAFLGGRISCPAIVRCALIQASNALSTERPLAQIRKAMIDKHLKLIEQAAKKKNADPLPAGAFLRPLFLCRAKRALVRTDRTRARRPDHAYHAEARREASHGHRGSGL